MNEYEYRDFAGIEQAQYDRYREGEKPWGCAAWLLTVMVAAVLCIAQVH